MTDYMWRLELLPADKMRFTVGELLEAIAIALNPDDGADSPSRLDLKRAATIQDHEEKLKRCVENNVVTLRNPLTGDPTQLWVGNAESWLLSRGHVEKLCGLLAIEIVPRRLALRVVETARPSTVSQELQALDADDSVVYEYLLAGSGGSGNMNAADYVATLREKISRQAEGFFTLDEAAQILANVKLAKDASDTVKRFRAAHLNDELPVHKCDGRFRMTSSERVSAHFDLLQETELDAWLRATAGYGFPKAEVASMPASAPEFRVTQDPAQDRGRRLKRAALIADNVRRWPTIERDLKDAAANELSKSAKDDAVGWWWEGSAIHWAQARSKVQDVASGVAGLSSQTHRI